MKGVGIQGLATFAIGFVGVVLMLPVLSGFVDAVSTYLNPAELVVASLIGVVVLLALFKTLFDSGSGNQAGYYG